MINKRNLGNSYEQKASKYLKDNGYHILCENYYCRFGEIDIIARKDGVIIFVEVKYRNANSMVNSLEAVGYAKQKVISKCAKYYLTVKRCLNSACRFDVIGFQGEKIIHIENAFEYIS